MTWNIDIHTNKILKVQRFPELIYGGKETNVLKDWLVLPLDIGQRVEEIFIFHGLDRGDIVEMDSFIYDGLRPIIIRDFHKEIMAHFSAYEHYPNVNHEIEQGINIEVLCRVNGRNELDFVTAPRKHDLSARPHFGYTFILRGEDGKREYEKGFLSFSSTTGGG